MRPDLKAYVDLEDADQPVWLTEEFRSLCGSLRDAQVDDDWFGRVAKFRARGEDWIATGRIVGKPAAGVLFVTDALEAARTAEGGQGGFTVLGYVLQLTLSPEQWGEFLKAMAADGISSGEEDSRPMRLARFHEQLLMHFVKRGRFAVIRDLYRLVRFRIDELARRAMRSAKDFDCWVGDLALLAAHLTMRRWLPLTVHKDPAGERGGRVEIVMGDEGHPTGGQFMAPPEVDHPILAELFDPAEIQTLHRKEAYAAECFAHLYTSVFSGYVTEEHQKKVAEEYRRHAEEDRIGARQWLTFGKSRFEIAPYL